MLPLYEKTENELDIRHIRSKHIAPHLHEALECVYVTDGTLEIGIGKRDASMLPVVIAAEDRSLAGFLAPARGLFLRKVYY